uniref:Uncharacterized protein n=1 Tax=Anguilla anguilla TaxID=7936 RepID=A0A0E9VWU9_ANGAN
MSLIAIIPCHDAFLILGILGCSNSMILGTVEDR